LHYACKPCARPVLWPGRRSARPRRPAPAGVAEDAVDLVLCMSVDPGWGNQQLIPNSYDKLKRLRAALAEHVALEVDGGVHEETARRCAESGATAVPACGGVRRR